MHTTRHADTYLSESAYKALPVLMFNAGLAAMMGTVRGYVLSNEMPFSVWMCFMAVADFGFVYFAENSRSSRAEKFAVRLALAFVRWFAFRIVLYPVHSFGLAGVLFLARAKTLPINIRWMPVCAMIPSSLIVLYLKAKSNFRSVVTPPRNNDSDMVEVDTSLLHEEIPHRRAVGQVRRIKDLLIGDLFATTKVRT